MPISRANITPVDPNTGREDTLERILEAAVRVFAENGYARSTTRALAAAAGITEVTLFRHFESKEKLFAAAVERYGGPAVTTALETQLTGADYRADLLRMGKLFIDIMLERRDAVRLMLCEAGHFPELTQTLAQNPRLIRQMIARYLQRQVEQGRVRPLNVEAAAQAFMGMIFAYSMTLNLFDEPALREMSPHDIVAHFVDLFVDGTIAQE